MSESPGSEEEADKVEFERVLRNLVSTPHMPHVKKPETEPAEKADKGGDQR